RIRRNDLPHTSRARRATTRMPGFAVSHSRNSRRNSERYRPAGFAFVPNRRPRPTRTHPVTRDAGVAAVGEAASGSNQKEAPTAWRSTFSPTALLPRKFSDTPPSKFGLALRIEGWNP